MGRNGEGRRGGGEGKEGRRLKYQWFGDLVELDLWCMFQQLAGRVDVIFPQIMPP